MEYYKLWECPQCDKEIYVRCFNGHEKNGIPVFDTMMFESEYVTCDADGWRHEETDEWISDKEWKELEEEEQDKYSSEECGCEFGTGDIEIMVA